MVRIGKVMYGGGLGSKTAVTISTNIVAVQQIAKGSTVGYGGTFVASKPMTVGILDCGYGVAGFLLLGGVTHINIDGKPCKILGRVCMDNTMIDVDGISNPLGKSVTIIGDMLGATLMDYVKMTGHSEPRLLCSIRL
jgi:alanine racemase